MINLDLEILSTGFVPKANNSYLFDYLDLRLELFVEKHQTTIGYSLRRSTHDREHQLTANGEVSNDSFVSLQCQPEEFRIIPATPNRPLLLKPIHAPNVFNSQEIRLWIAVPLNLQILVKNTLVYDLPVRQLSSTWYGEPDEGDLAYTLHCRMVQHKNIDEKNRGVIWCPIVLKNESPQIMTFSRFLFRANLLPLFCADNLFISAETDVIYKGQDHGADVSYGKTSPLEFVEATFLAQARQTEWDDNLLRRSFHFIKSISNV